MDKPLRDVASSLTLEAASKIVDGALRAARAENLLPLAVAVLDSGGHLVAFKREDGCGLLRVEIAQGKARGALGMGIPSRTIAQRLSNRPNFVTAVVAASGGEFVPVPGGVLILDARGAAIGAVGISGDTSDKDEYCAIQGVRGAGMTPDRQPSPPTAREQGDRRRRTRPWLCGTHGPA